MQKVARCLVSCSRALPVLIGLLLSPQVGLSLPPGKLKDFVLQECNQSVCYRIIGPQVVSSKFSELLAGVGVTVSILSKSHQVISSIHCDDFSLELADKIGTCIVNKGNQVLEINLQRSTLKPLLM